ncbi:adenylate/guanylate cyclase domain-containing protein [Rhizobium sp. BR 317]|uniref:ATP-binding protein n=1 Tax=Rhizobium sp. BR 317 TaxID=3040015 RepID=UPI0039BF7422
MAKLREWLESRGLGRYAAALLAHDIESDILPQLTDADLATAGLPVGARKRLLQAIGELSKDDGLEPLPRPIVSEVDPAAEAERRQLTVLFCDVVGSTHLAETLDPEDLRDLLLSFQKVCADAVQRNGGQIGLFIGDGVTAYFGYPKAHEDSAQSAVQAGLDILAALAELRKDGLLARCGVHTGQVVVGEMGAGEKRLRDGIVGEAPNIAARLQGLAPPGNLVMSDATLRLVEGLFEVEPLGPQVLKGVSAPTETYRVLRSSSAPNRFEARTGQFLTSLIGRETELGLLAKRWQHAMEGEGQAVLLQGEPGIGKSRLLQTLRAQLCETPHSEIVFYCSPQHQSSALWPVIQQLHRALASVGEQCGGKQHQRLRQFLADLDLDVAEVVDPLARLLGPPVAPGMDTTPSDAKQVRRAVFLALSRIISAMQQRSATLLIIEDSHWIDPSTAELVGQLLSGMACQRLLVLISARPEFRTPWSSSSLAILPLAKLSYRETEAMIRDIASRELPEAMLAQLIAKTDGVPLFVEELTKSIAENGSHGDFGTTFEIPATLQAALLTRLDRLAPIRQIIQTAALLGRLFDADLLTKVTQRDADTVERALRDLTEAGLIYLRRDRDRESYEFKHALIQDAAIGTLLRYQRAELHRRIAAALAELRAEAVDRNPELLAHHLQEGGDFAGALDHWQRAGDAALARAATQEAVSHFGGAIACSRRLDQVSGGAERMSRLHLSMANALMQAEGYRSDRLGNTLEDARVAAADTPLVELQCDVALSLAAYFYATGRNRDYLTLVEEQLANCSDRLQPAYLAGLWATKGIAHSNRGELPLAAEALRKALDLIDQVDPAHRISFAGADQRVSAQEYFTETLTLMGFFDAAVETKKQVIRSFDQSDRPFELAWHHLTQCELCALLGQHEELLEHATKIVAICERHGYMARRSSGIRWRGYARSHLGELDGGIEDVRESMRLWRGQGVVFHTTEKACALCDLLMRAGRIEEASQILDDVNALAFGTDEASHQAECIRLRGQIAAGRNDLTGAVHLFEKAIATSKRQGARLFELRASTQLTLALARQGRVHDGGTRLRTLIDSFETKLPIVDLVDAREALERCSNYSG